jgi:hypothetical protein
MYITDTIWEILEPATHTGEAVTREEIETGLQKGRYQLFVDTDSAAITAGNGEILRIGLAGGSLPCLKKIEKKIEKYAKKKKYKKLDILGRLGWERSLTGYKRQAVLLRKEL